MRSKKTAAGFTLLEIMLVVAMIGILASFSVIMVQGAVWRADMATSMQTIAYNLRRAQTLARAQVTDSDWGVRLEGNTLTIFRGSDFNERDEAYDEIIDLSSTEADAATEVIFQKFSGEVQEPQEISLTSSQESASMSINSFGTIEY